MKRFHEKNMHTALQKIHRWLKPGGVFISNTACVADTMDHVWRAGTLLEVVAP